MSSLSQAEEPDEKEKRLLALAWAAEPELVNATLQYALSDAVRAQDAPMLIRAVARRGGSSLEAAWSFLQGYDPAPVTSTSQYSPGMVSKALARHTMCCCPSRTSFLISLCRCCS